MNERRPEESLKIENIVASAKVTDSLDLPSLASQLKDAEYNKKRFPGVVLRMQDPKIAALDIAGRRFIYVCKIYEHFGDISLDTDAHEELGEFFVAWRKVSYLV